MEGLPRNLNSYQLLTLGSPACVLQLRISHLWRVQVPRLPGVHRQKKQCYQIKVQIHSHSTATTEKNKQTSVAHLRTKV